MKRKMTRFLAIVLTGIMMTSVLPTINVRAENTVNVLEETIGGVENNTSESEEIKQEITEESSAELNYIYLNKNYLEEQETQDIMVSWGDGTQEIEHMVLKLSNESGEIISLEGTKYEAETVLFSNVFEKGIYEIVGLEVTMDTTKEVTMEDYGICAFFGVGEKYSGEKSEYMEMESIDEYVDAEVEFAVASLDQNNMDANAEKIAETLAIVDTSAVATMSLEDEQGIAAISDREENLVIVLDPGHDSGHAGTRGNGVFEEVATLKIAQYCREELEQYAGVTVYLTREGASCPFPETVGVDGGNVLDIKKRVNWAKSMGADVFVSIHLNSWDTSTVHGAEVYYPSQSTEGKSLAQKIQNELVNLGLYNRGIKTNDAYAVISSSEEAGFPGLIVEHAFVSNSSDATNYLKTEDGLKKLGIADATGIATYYGLEIGELPEHYEGWIQTDDGWMWESDGQYYKNRWLNIENEWYWMDANGYRVTGQKKIGDYYYYFDSEGRMLTGLQKIDGKTYYFHSAGRMLTGWQTINGKTYYFAADGAMVTGIVTIDGKKHQFGNDGVYQGEVQTRGWNLIDGTYYYVKADGSNAVGWELIGGYYYYFDKEGRMLTGWQEIGGYKYYFHSAGRMLTGWQKIDGKTYYFHSGGRMLTGWQKIDGEWNYFESNGQFKQSGVTNILGKSQKTKEQMIALYNQSGYTYPTEALEKGGAKTIEEFVQIYIEEASIEGIRADVAFAQAMLETKYLQFGGDVKIEQFNFAGLGATGNGVPGNSFDNVRIGIRAQIQHLKAYASSEPLKQECVDDRYVYVTKESAPYVEWLGIQENPDGKGWAVSKNYGFSVIELLNKM